MTRAAALPLVLLLPALAGCAKRATPDECLALLDHGVELSVRDRRPGATDAEVATERAARRDDKAGRATLATCPAEVSKRALTCALAAPHLDEYERCLVETPFGVR